jgi:hypothetical protein
MARHGAAKSLTYMVITEDAKVLNRSVVVAGERETLTILQAEVGGYVEPLYLGEYLVAWVNEDGLRLGTPVNVIGTMLVHAFNGPISPFLVGPLALTGRRGAAITGLSPRQRRLLRRACGHISLLTADGRWQPPLPVAG